MDFDLIALILSTVASNFAIFWAIISLKNEISDNKVRIIEVDQKSQGEFNRCCAHPILTNQNKEK